MGVEVGDILTGSERHSSCHCEKGFWAVHLAQELQPSSLHPLGRKKGQRTRAQPVSSFQGSGRGGADCLVILTPVTCYLYRELGADGTGESAPSSKLVCQASAIAEAGRGG